MVESCCNVGFDNQEVELDLSPELSRDYSNTPCFENGINNLIMETEEHRGKKIKIVTRRDGTAEILEILSSGDPLSKETLQLVNAKYQEGKNLSERPRYSGSKIAAFQLAQLGGKIFIENTELQPYTVRNYVRFS